MIHARITILACAVGVVLHLLGCDGSRRPPDDVLRMEPQLVGPEQPRISLENPEALEALRVANPEHYRKINELLAGLASQPDIGARQWAKVSFGADNLSDSQVLYTSLPPKQYATFELEGTIYTALVPQKPYVPPVPAKR